MTISEKKRKMLMNIFSFGLKPLGLFVRMWPQSSPGGGVILYYIKNQRLYVAFSQRKVGHHKGLWSFYGGFIEIHRFFKKPIGYHESFSLDALRELAEEAPEHNRSKIEASFTQKRCLQHGVFLPAIHVRAGDENVIHSPSFVGIEINPKTEARLFQNGGSDEHGPAEFCEIIWKNLNSDIGVKAWITVNSNLPLAYDYQGNTILGYLVNELQKRGKLPHPLHC